MTKRKQLSKRVRFEIFKRDGFVCQYCGNHPPSVILHVDHIVPVVEGGSNEDTNLITSCADCNLGKAANSLNTIPKSLKEKAASIQEAEAQIAGYAAVCSQARERIEADVWSVAEVLTPGAQEGYPKRRFQSIRMFVKRLSVDDVLDAAEITDSKFWRSEEDKFRYFCGICWKKIRDSE